MSIYSGSLREQITACAAEFARKNSLAFRRSHIEFGSGVFFPDWERLSHGNFHPASYRAILRRSIWSRRLGKALTVPERLQRVEDDRRLCELDSAAAPTHC